MPDDPITQWMLEGMGGDERALRQLWDEYFVRLVRLAEGKLMPKTRRAVDGEDVALSAFYSFVEGAKKGQFARLEDRTDLWSLLAVITARKAYAKNRHAHCGKQGDGKVRGESAFRGADSAQKTPGLQAFLSSDPTPEEIVTMAEERERLMAALPKDRYRRIAELRMQGHTVAEIMAELGNTRRTIERGLQIIREVWNPDGVQGEG